MFIKGLSLTNSSLISPYQYKKGTDSHPCPFAASLFRLTDDLSKNDYSYLHLRLQAFIDADTHQQQNCSKWQACGNGTGLQGFQRF